VAEIYLDGEAVQFDGPAPSSWEQLLALIEQSLAASGRVLAGAAIDGVGVEAAADPSRYAAAARIDVRSLSLAEAVAQVSGDCARRARELGAEGGELCQAVVRQPWPGVVAGVLAFGGRLGEFLQQASGLVSDAGWAACADELTTALGPWMDAVAASDAAEVCVRLDRDILPVLERAAQRAGPGGAGTASS